MYTYIYVICRDMRGSGLLSSQVQLKCICMYMNICICIYICVCQYIYIYVYVFIYMYACMQAECLLVLPIGLNKSQRSQFNEISNARPSLINQYMNHLVH